jgi:hypothetical protein
VSEGSATKTRRGSTDTTTACAPYTALMVSMALAPLRAPPAASSASAAAPASLPMETLSAPAR